MQKQKRGTIFDLIFWSLCFLYQWSDLAAFSRNNGHYFFYTCMTLPLTFLFSYFTVHVVLKKFYGHKLKFWFFQIALTLVLLLLRRFLFEHLLYPKHFPKAPAFSSPEKWIIELVNSYLIVSLYALFYFVRSCYEKNLQEQSLLLEGSLTELERLKLQTQPHFIVNTLTSIHATAVSANPETAKLIAHLASFMNYNLYESKQSLISLASEMACLEHYIALQKNRYGNKLNASIRIYEDIGDLFIAPLLLLPLVENSFKHGIERSINKSWIRINVSRQTDYFSVQIENSIEENTGITEDQKSGVGITNVQKRLGLIYPNAHEFKILQQPHSYLVALKLKIVTS